MDNVAVCYLVLHSIQYPQTMWQIRTLIKASPISGPQVSRSLELTESMVTVVPRYQTL